MDRSVVTCRQPFAGRQGPKKAACRKPRCRMPLCSTLIRPCPRSNPCIQGHGGRTGSTCSQSVAVYAAMIREGIAGLPWAGSPCNRRGDIADAHSPGAQARPRKPAAVEARPLMQFAGIGRQIAIEGTGSSCLVRRRLGGMPRYYCWQRSLRRETGWLAGWRVWHGYRYHLVRYIVRNARAWSTQIKSTLRAPTTHRCRSRHERKPSVGLEIARLQSTKTGIPQGPAVTEEA